MLQKIGQKAMKAKITVEIDGVNVATCEFDDVEKGWFNVDYESGPAKELTLALIEVMVNLMLSEETAECGEVLH